MPRQLALLIFFTVWVANVFYFNPLKAVNDRFVALTMSIVEHKTIDCSAYQGTSDIDVIPYHGKFYIDTNPGLAFLAVPSWSVVYTVYRHISPASRLRAPNSHFLLAALTATVFTTSLAGALTAALLANFVFLRTGQKWRATLAAFLYAFGTIAFYLSTRTNQNVVIALIGLVIYCLIYEPSAVLVSSKHIRQVLLGACAGLAVFIDLSILPLLFVLLIPIGRIAGNLRGAAAMIVPALVPIVALFVYQQTAFGNAYLPAQMHLAHFAGACVPRLSALLANTVLPSEGLFLYMPFTLLAVWYLANDWRDPNDNLPQEEKTVFVGLFAIYLAYVSTVQSSQFGGFGPRYLLPILPYLTILFALFWRRQHFTFGTILIALSLFVQMAGAQRGIESSNVFFVIALWLIRGPWLPILDWLQQNLSSVTGFNPANISPFGLLSALYGFIAAIWLPHLWSEFSPLLAAKRTSGAGGEL